MAYLFDALVSNVLGTGRMLPEILLMVMDCFMIRPASAALCGMV